MPVRARPDADLARGNGNPPAPPEHIEDERKHVTVLFADLKDTTPAVHGLDPEHARSLLDGAVQNMIEAVHQYNGTVGRIQGDGIMAIFGAPIAGEHHATQACQAALAIHAALHRYGEETLRQFGTELSGRVGLNSGRVLVRAIAEHLTMEYSGHGEATHVAARLEQLAARGSTLLSLDTLRLLDDLFDVKAVGFKSLKGLVEPVEVFELLRVRPERAPNSSTGPRTASGATRAGLEAFGMAAPMIARETELGMLLAAFDRMLSARTQVVSLVGEAGIGKSRLLSEFLAIAQSDARLESGSLTVRRARFAALGPAPYRLLAAIFRDAWGVSPADPYERVKEHIAAGLVELGYEEAAVETVAPVLGHILDVDYGDGRLSNAEPEQLKRQLYLLLRELFERRLQRGPFLIAIEDLQWADVASIELLRFLVDHLYDRQLLLVLTHRPHFDVSRMISSRIAYTSIRLVPLAPSESEALLNVLISHPPATAHHAPGVPTAVGALQHGQSDQLRAMIVHRSGGNPFHLQEIVRSLIQSRVLTRAAGVWSSTRQPEKVDVPPTVEAVLLARLDRLPAGARRLVQEAAVLGPEFGGNMLHAVCTDPDALEANLEVIQSAELLDEVTSEGRAASETRYRFAHVLIQEVAYESLLLRRRAELHARAGRAVQVAARQRGSEGLEDLVAMGHHFRMSTEKVTGARYLMAAGDWARAIYANEDAAAYYQLAIDALSGCDVLRGDEQLRRLHEALADVLAHAGRRDEALMNSTMALNEYAETNDRPGQARMRRKIGWLHWTCGNRKEAEANYQKGLMLLEGFSEEIELARLYEEMGRVAFRSGDNDAAIRWSEQARVLGESLVDRSGAAEMREAATAVANAHNTTGVAMARRGNFAEAVALVQQGVAVATHHELFHVACRAYANLSVLYGTSNPKQAIESSLAGLELAKRIGDPGLEAWLLANLASAYCMFGEQCTPDAITAAEAAVGLDVRLGQRDHLGIAMIVMAQIYQCGGQPQRAREYFFEALQLAQEMREPQLLFACYNGLGTLYLEAGDDARAECFLRRGEEVCQEAGLTPDSLLTLPFLA